MPFCSQLWALALAASSYSQPQAPPATGAPPANLTVAVMPAQFFSADAQSAARITEGVRQDFSSKGWNVLPQDTVTAAWEAMGLRNGVHYPDRTAIELGRKLNADLIVYPRLLALGIPLNQEPTAPAASSGRSLPPTLLEPAAVLHLRVMNVRRNRSIYFNQIAHPYRADRPVDLVAFNLPAAEGQGASTHVLAGFFQRVAGSREVLGPEPPARAKSKTKGKRRGGQRMR